LDVGVRESVYESLLETENKLGRPVNKNEIYAIHK
jgi:hypothetical protein